MTNAEKFKCVFGLYATELWAMDEDEMLKWLNAECKEPERKKGRWIKVDNGYSYWHECSECGCEPLRSKWNGQEVFSDFCPNCGANMRGE